MAGRGKSRIHKEDVKSIIEEALDLSETGICICDTAGNLNFINKNALKIMQIDEAPYLDALNSENIQNLCGDYCELLKIIGAANIIKSYEFPLKRDISNVRWITNDVYKINYKGKDIVIIFIRDISYYKNLEVDLRRSQKKLSSIIETIPDIVYRVDPEGLITFVNDSIKEYGYDPKELIGKNIIEIVHPDDRVKARHKIIERRTGERKTKLFEVRLLSKNHKVITFEIEGSRVENDHYFQISSEGIYINAEKEEKFFVGTQGIARDITKKRNIEFELERSRERWTSILNSLEDAYYEVDLKGIYNFVNKSYCDIVGYSYEETVGKSYKKFYTSDEARIVFKIFNDLYNSGEQSAMYTLKVLRKDGKKRTIEGSISVTRDNNGKINGFRGIIRDTSARVKMEEELLRARKLEAIGILSGGIAHDYNNALTAILGNISLAKMEVGDSKPALNEILDDAEKASMKIMELTKRLSVFAKGGRPDKKKVVIRDFLKETVDSVLYNYRGTSEMQVQDDLWDVEIDEIQIGHVIENILKNSIEAKPEGGHIFISAKNMAVDREESHHEITLQQGDYVVITISDDGPGISDEIIENIFDPYFTTKDFASGMGLAASYAIIKRHRGYIDVKTGINQGATVNVYLPIL